MNRAKVSYPFIKALGRRMWIGDMEYHRGVFLPEAKCRRQAKRFMRICIASVFDLPRRQARGWEIV